MSFMDLFFSLLDAEECGNSENNWQIYWNRTCTNIEDFCGHYEYDDYINNTFCIDSTIENPVPVPVQNLSFRVSSAEEFWYKKVLELSVNFTGKGKVTKLMITFSLTFKKID